MTPIQAESIGPALQGKDLLASSKTGSGKTLAFLIPAVQRMLRSKPLSKKDPRALILAPTRELAKQVFMQVKWLTAKHSLSTALVLGGENFNDQVKALRRNPQIVVGTAGRVADHLKDKSLYLNGLELLILDEADRMLDLGFVSELKHINAAADHRKRQTMMFSATLDNTELHHLTKTLLNAPTRVSIGKATDTHGDITQEFVFADHIEHKDALLTHVLEKTEFNQAIVFTATREDTGRLADLLKAKNIDAIALSADLTQGQRANIMNGFSRGQHDVLVTTDVASRGLDLLQVSLVINFDLPKMSDEYIHRIGRTGRAGAKGHAMSFVGPKDWKSYVAIKSRMSLEDNFRAFDGFEATFKGYEIKKAKKRKTPNKNTKAKKSENIWNKPKTKRVRMAEGVDVGSAPMKRKKRTIPDSDIDASED